MGQNPRVLEDCRTVLNEGSATECATSDLLSRVLPDGGFVGVTGCGYRPDATAWAVLALCSASGPKEVIEAARKRLEQDQCDDGRVSLDPDYPQTYWPTPLAVLAWHGSPNNRQAEDLAIRFLLATSGAHQERSDDFPGEHDPSLRGWTWIDGTNSWVEPTALVVSALRAAGQGANVRVGEAVELLLDRQLFDGGWNCGNTVVFGQELRPTPLSTGLATHALAGLVSRQRIERSLEYLHRVVPGLHGPLSLSWALLGLSAWGERPHRARSWIDECLGRQEQLGCYGTSMLSLLLLAFLGEGGLESVLGQRKSG